MAIVNLTVRKLADWNEFGTPVTSTNLFEALNASDGGRIAWNFRDDKVLIVAQNTDSAAHTLTVKAGNGLQRAAGDLEISLGSGMTTFVAIDSGRFKNVSGDNRGYVLLNGKSATVKVAVFKMP